MRHLVVVAGGNASGKTTFAKAIKAAVPEDKLLVINGDIGNIFKALVEDKRERFMDLMDRERRHILFEGARAVTGMWDLFFDYGCPHLIFVIVTMSGQRLIDGIKNRQNQNGREFSPKQAGYWDAQNSDYEARRRYLRMMTKLGRDYPDQAAQTELRVVHHAKPFPDFSAYEPEFEYLVNLFNTEDI
jgi:hypothetical protein